MDRSAKLTALSVAAQRALRKCSPPPRPAVSRHLSRSPLSRGCLRWAIIGQSRPLRGSCTNPHPARETGQRGDVGSHLRPHFMVDPARITLCATAAAASELLARQADADGGDLAVNRVVLSHLQRPVGSAVARVSTSGERLRAQQSALRYSGVASVQPAAGISWALGRRLAEVDDPLQPHP